MKSALFLLILPLISGCVINPKMKTHLAAPLKGTVTKGNIPVEGVVIKRTCVSATHSSFPDQVVVTDASGNYELPAIYPFTPFILINYPGVYQHIYITIHDEDRLVYKNSRNNYDKFGELEGDATSPYDYKISKTEKYLQLNIDLEDRNNLNHRALHDQ